MLIYCQEEIKRLNKTVEGTEHLLLELKEQCQYHCEDSLSSSCSTSYSMCSTNNKTALSQGLYATMDQTGQLPFATRIYNRVPLLEEQVSATQGVAKDQMAALAAELEAELELMELNMNSGDVLLDQSLIHDPGEVSVKGMQSSCYSDTSSQGMVEASYVGRRSTHTEASQSECGVSPIELDHRLREFLEAQQQERILELEKLLKETEAKLLAKEHEILGWKNHVNSLANLVQHASACGTHVNSCINDSSAESASLYDSFVADVPEVAKNSLGIVHSFQDPPISTQVKYGESFSNSNFPAKVSRQETSMRNCSPRVFLNDVNSFNNAFYSSAPSHEGSIIRESNCCWDGQEGTGIDTSVFVVLDDFNAHTTGQNSESRRGQPVSKGLETNDRIPPDDQMHASDHGFNGHSDSFLIDGDGENTGSSGLKIVSSSSPHISCEFDTIETSLSSYDFGRTEVEKDFADVKHFVSSINLKRGMNNRSSVQGVQVPKRGLKSKNESIQMLTKRSREATSQRGSVEGTSPVLDKIRHYEALVGNGRGKRS